MKRAHGQGVKRYIKYDEPSFSLVLELRIPGNEAWLRIPPRLAVELRQRSESEDVDRARSLLTARPARQRIPGELGSPNYIPITNLRTSAPVAAASSLISAAAVAGSTASGLFHRPQTPATNAPNTKQPDNKETRERSPPLPQVRVGPPRGQRPRWTPGPRP